MIDTYKEMQPFFLFNMNPEERLMCFRESATNLLCPLATAVWERWEVGKPMPAKGVEQILQELAGNSSDQTDADGLSPVSHVLTATTNNASGEGGHVDEARAKMCEATGKGESFSKRRELFKDAIKLLRAEPLAGHAQALLSYAHYGAGVCRMREREYAEARRMLDEALQIGTGLSKGVAKCPGNLAGIAPGPSEQTVVESRLRQGLPKRQVAQ
jgi:hypothetical protein